MSEFTSRVISATKWSVVTEILAKLVSPVSTMILARLLAPEAFGVLVTSTMVISFAEIFTDAGFQKYLVQHEFADDSEKFKTTTTAFWSNLVLSLLIWLIIIAFSEPIAALVGNPGKGNVIAISCVCIPLAAFSSIQLALYKRDFDFKTLFSVRLIGVLIPIFITIPLAYITRSYWALIIGMIALNFSNAVLLTLRSKWKPTLSFSWGRLKSMLSFSLWSIMESVSIWLTNYVDVFIVGTLLSQHYLGIYKTSITVVGQIMAVITSSTTPVLYSSLSRLQNDRDEYNAFFLKFQKIISYVIFPLGVGIYLFRDLITDIILGNQWAEAAGFIGLWALISTIVIVLSYYTSEICRSKGLPSISFASQILHLMFLIPVLYFTSIKGFEALYHARALIRLQAVAVDLIIIYLLTKISPLKILANISSSLISVAFMYLVYRMLPLNTNIGMSVIYIILCGLAYVSALLLFPSDRVIIKKLIRNLRSKL